ncbi:MAG: Bbp16 family capsid cement protein [Methylobacter sp.]|jgi:hypothetical protein
MLTDANLLLSGAVSAANVLTAQTVTGTDTSVLSTNAIDLGIARDVGEGEPLFGRFECLTSASGGTSVEMQIIASDAANGTGNVQVIASTGAIPVASVIAGARFAARLNPRLASKGQRYLTARYVFVGIVAAGAYVADIGLEISDGQKFYGSGFAIL